MDFSHNDGLTSIHRIGGKSAYIVKDNIALLHAARKLTAYKLLNTLSDTRLYEYIEGVIRI